MSEHPLADKLQALAAEVKEAGFVDIANPLDRFVRILSAKERGTEGSNGIKVPRRGRAG